MEINSNRKWYRKKRYIIPGLAVGLIIIISILSNQSSVNNSGSLIGTPGGQVKGINLTPLPDVNSDQNVSSDLQNASEQPNLKIQNTAPVPIPVTIPKTYQNSDGNTTQSPTYYDSRPSSASALCRDGTYSFSAHRSGTCSHHGGVAQWY